jgi:hypothetical protein
MAFREQRTFLARNVLPILRESGEYLLDDPQAEETLDRVLLLGDRVLAACSGSVEIDRAADLGDTLRSLPGIVQGQDPLDHLTKLERWLKAVLWLIDPGRSEKGSGKRSYNLYAVVCSLGLLSGEELELDVEKANQIRDPVRRRILQAKEHRNPGPHSPSGVSILPADAAVEIAIGLLAPLVKHRKAVGERLRHLIAWPLPLDIAQALDAQAAEQQGHAKAFRGRSGFLQDLEKDLGDLRGEGGYLLLLGDEGSGKSGVCAALVERMGGGNLAIGQHCEDVRHHAPWLPGVVFCSGKQCKDPTDIARLVVGQVGALLLDPPGVRAESAAARWRHAEYEDGEDPRRTASRTRQVRGRQRPPRVRADPERLADPLRKAGLDNPEIRRQTIEAYLRRLVDERGDGLLIFDALDEMSADGLSLDFLPERLPPGVSCLLTSRPLPGILRELGRRLKCVKQMHLEGLSRADVALVTGRSDTDEPARALNDRLYEATCGWPLGLRSILPALPQSMTPEALATLDVDSSLHGIFERQVSDWRSHRHAFMNDLLLFLAAFEPVAPLEVERIQGYLASRSHDLSAAGVREALARVAALVEGVQADQIKLARPGLSQYVVERDCSTKDRRKLFEWIVAWLVDDKTIPAKLLGGFFSTWISSEDAAICEPVDGLVSELLGAGRGDTVEEVGAELNLPWLERAVDEGHTGAMVRLAAHRLWASEPRDPLGAFGLLGKAADRGELRAAHVLGMAMLHGWWGMPDNTAKGEEWLRMAANGGHAGAMDALGEALVRKTLVELREGEGLDWLRQGAEAGDEDAMFHVGLQLLKDKSPKVARQGQTWLERAALAGHAGAKEEIAGGLSRGREHHWLPDIDSALATMERVIACGDMPTEVRDALARCIGAADSSVSDFGQRFVRDLASRGDPWAVYELGCRLLDGGGLPQDQKEGERLLRLAAGSGYSVALLELTSRLFTGEGSTANPGEAERLLRDAAAAGANLPMADLGTRLLEGDGVAVNQTEGLRLLRDATVGGGDEFRDLRILMADFEIDARVDGADRGEGERILRAEAEAGACEARSRLVWRLALGQGLAINLAEAVSLLGNHTNGRDDDEQLALYLRLVHKLLAETPAKVEEARQILTWVAEQPGADSSALTLVGDRMIDLGLGTKGEEVLRRAAEHWGPGFEAAPGTILGERLLFGRGLPANPAEGKRLLTEVIEAYGRSGPFSFLCKYAWEPLAAFGARLLVGDGMEADPDEGLRLLESAVAAESDEAMILLGTALLDGRGLERDEARGRELLQRAVDARSLEAAEELARRLRIGEGLPIDLSAAAAMDERVRTLRDYREGGSGVDWGESGSGFRTAFRSYFAPRRRRKRRRGSW